mmetsp:Transcript_60764/g.177527  ORF Transcript_60764/g.177527 Transcript_60764/m.177527 type:complete len:280 (-) Transcript_60764:940-1779(-)
MQRRPLSCDHPRRCRKRGGIRSACSTDPPSMPRTSLPGSCAPSEPRGNRRLQRLGRAATPERSVATKSRLCHAPGLPPEARPHLSARHRLRPRAVPWAQAAPVVEPRRRPHSPAGFSSMAFQQVSAPLPSWPVEYQGWPAQKQLQHPVPLHLWIAVAPPPAEVSACVELGHRPAAVHPVPWPCQMHAEVARPACRQPGSYSPVLCSGPQRQRRCWAPWLQPRELEVEFAAAGTAALRLASLCHAWASRRRRREWGWQGSPLAHPLGTCPGWSGGHGRPR